MLIKTTYAKICENKTLVCFSESIKGSMVDCLMPLKNAINKIYVKEGLLVYMLTVGR